MSDLLTQRIQVSAAKLKLLPLAAAVDTLINRVQEGQVGYREFLDLDRLRHQAEVHPINGPSYRLKDRLTLGRAGSRARTS
jgi:hypothetical protein